MVENSSFVSVCSRIREIYAGLLSPAYPFLSLPSLTVSKTSAALPEQPFKEVHSDRLRAFRDSPLLVGSRPTSPQLGEAFSKVP